MSLQCANWYDWDDRALYEELNQKRDEDLTEEQRRFCIDMYHAEEYASGLDGR